MREFDQRIEAWKKQAMMELGGDAERVAELESHLRQSLEEFAPGKPAEEAWRLAMAQMGELPAIKKEFGKIDRGFWTMDKIAMAAIGSASFLVFLGFLMPWLARSDYKGDIVLNVHVGMIFAGYMMSIAAGLMGLYLGTRRIWGVSVNDPQMQSAYKMVMWLIMFAGAASAAGVVLGMVWTSKHWGQAWGNDPKEIGGAIVVFFLGTLSALLLTHKLSPARAVALAPMAIPITIGAWFAMMFALDNGLHSYGIGVGQGTFLFWWSVGLAVCVMLSAAAWSKSGRTVAE